MDALSQELQDFLIRLGREPGCVSEKVEHYIRHIMHLVYADEEIFDDLLLREFVHRHAHVFNNGLSCKVSDIFYMVARHNSQKSNTQKPKVEPKKEKDLSDEPEVD